MLNNVLRVEGIGDGERGGHLVVARGGGGGVVGAAALKYYRGTYVNHDVYVACHILFVSSCGQIFNPATPSVGVKPLLDPPLRDGNLDSTLRAES